MKRWNFFSRKARNIVINKYRDYEGIADDLLEYKYLGKFKGRRPSSTKLWKQFYMRLHFTDWRNTEIELRYFLKKKVFKRKQNLDLIISSKTNIQQLASLREISCKGNNFFCYLFQEAQWFSYYWDTYSISLWDFMRSMEHEYYAESKEELAKMEKPWNNWGIPDETTWHAKDLESLELLTSFYPEALIEATVVRRNTFWYWFTENLGNLPLYYTAYPEIYIPLTIGWVIFFYIVYRFIKNF